MKKLKITFLLLIIMLLSSVTYVFAANVGVTLEGDTTAVAGETKTLTITLNTDQLDTDSVVAGINATLTYSDNVSDVSISTADNSWGVLSKNDDTGEFAATDGNQKGSSEILIIQYTVASNATGTATISLTDISLSVAPAYETITADDVTATIEITEESSKTLTGIEVTSIPTTTDYEEGEYFSTEGMVVTATYSDGTTAVVTDYTYSPTGALTTDDTKVTISYTEDGVTCTTTVSINVEEASGTNDGNNTNNNSTNDTNSNTNENDANSNTNSNSNNNNTNSNSSTSSGKNDDTTSNSSLPYTGSFKWIFATVVVVGIIGGMCYIKLQKYKDI